MHTKRQGDPLISCKWYFKFLHKKCTTETADFENYTEFQWRHQHIFLLLPIESMNVKTTEEKIAEETIVVGGDEEPEF